MARWSAFLTTAMIVALAVPNVAFADQKKPIKTTTTSGTITHRKAGKEQQEFLRASTGPTVPPKPSGSTGITPGWSTCTGGACPNPALQGSALQKSGVGSPPPRGYDLKANKGR
jgi:hypothetical protein